MPRRAAGIVIALLAGALAPALAACDPAGPPAGAAPASTVVAANATVVRVVDGDTIVVDVDGRRETVRLIGVDTPETVKPDSPVECHGPEASAYTAGVLPAGAPVRLERDLEARDDYGRLLAYVTLATDGTSINLELVRLGLATPLAITPNTTRAAELAAAATDAEAAGVGLWGACR